MTTPAPPPWQDTVAQEGSRLLDSMREVAPQITEAVVKYVWATGVTGVAISVVLVVMFGLATVWTFRWAYPKDRDARGDSGWAFLGSMVMLATAIGAGASFTTSMPKLLAPEGAAVMMALQALGGQ